MGSRQLILLENIGDKKDAYNIFLRELLRRSDILDAQAIVSIRSLLGDMQKTVTARISTEMAKGGAFETDADGKAQNWGLWWSSRLIDSVSEVVNKMSAEAGDLLGEYLLRSWTLGSDLVDGTIKAIAPSVSILAPKVSAVTLKILAPFSAQLITRINEETRAEIDKALRVSIALGESPFVLMKKLETRLTGKPSPFKSVAYRAEVITRTEVSRVHNLGRTARTEQAAAEYPELVRGPNRMMYKFVSVKRGEYPCEVCEPLNGKTWEIDDPDVPRPPMHPNCRCVIINSFNGITPVIVHHNAARQADASLSECLCCS